MTRTGKNWKTSADDGLSEHSDRQPKGMSRYSSEVPCSLSVKQTGVKSIAGEVLIPSGWQLDLSAQIGFSYRDFYFAAESIHQNVGFSGYPIGGISVYEALFGSVQSLCKAQSAAGES